MDRYFWDVYHDLLRGAQLAQGTLTPQQNADLQAAQAFLYTQTPDGLQTASPAAVLYSQYQNAWFQAAQNYKTQALTAGSSSDPNAKAQWQNTDEPRLRAQVQAAENDWETKGFKAQMEQAKQTELACAALSPQLKWHSWSSQFDPSLDMLTDPNNLSFAITGFSPSDVLDQTNWPTFTIAGSEIPQLISQAPKQLTDLYGTASGTTIQSLSFEYCSVALTRPWFRPEVFTARFWRFSDPSMQLSDGMAPPQGQWPAYITALVFARNIVVVTRTDTGTMQNQPVRTFPIVPLRATVAPAAPIKTAPAPPPPPRLAAQATASPAVMYRLQSSTFQTLPAARAGTIAGTARPAAAGPQFRPTIATAQQPRPMVATREVFMMPPRTGPSPPPQSTPAPSTAPPQQPPASDGRVSILAFICKRLPKCPNPDSALDWGSSAPASTPSGAPAGPAPDAPTAAAAAAPDSAGGSAAAAPADTASASGTSGAATSPAATPTARGTTP
jgi:hypothetical protein